MMREILRKINKKITFYLKNIIFYKYAKKDVLIHPSSYISNNVIIGIGTNINGPAFISASENSKIEIGKYCAIAHNLIIRTANHYIEYANMQAKIQNKIGAKPVHGKSEDVWIGNAVWIGDNVIILPGVTIGHGAVIGAGSIVSRDIPPFSVAVGVPAKPIKYRFSEEMITFLLELKWWDWSIHKMKKNKLFFETNLKNTNVNDVKKNII